MKQIIIYCILATLLAACNQSPQTLHPDSKASSYTIVNEYKDKFIYHWEFTTKGTVILTHTQLDKKHFEKGYHEPKERIKNAPYTVHDGSYRVDINDLYTANSIAPEIYTALGCPYIIFNVNGKRIGQAICKDDTPYHAIADKGFTQVYEEYLTKTGQHPDQKK